MASKNVSVEPDFYYSDYVAMNGPREGIKGFFDRHRATMQFILFMVFSILAFVAQIVVLNVGNAVLKNVTQTVYIWPFEPQALGTFISFLLANIAAKLISFVMNRKKTFGANNNPIFSAVSYTIMVVVLIIVETIIGGPLGRVLYNGFVAMGASASLSVENISNTLAMIIYSAADFLVVFFMDKFVIMRNVDHSDENVIVNENGITVDYNILP